ncbi:hypothetical protein LCL96_04325 [Rossellomorea aquimaris]|uniref:hypothetical protein n=1 Tax=Rossellomorea aquimaris TaxID=189382 RepID=UPI001CD752E1|nr:hypothetical protein [Rossellomorea aquimaris]MCA1058143.1 hypothetical protein [Rossellomorea aquimaris]
MKNIHERHVSISHVVLMEMGDEPVSTGVIKNNFGEVMTSSTVLTDEDVKIELTFKRDEKVFLPVTVVYNRETKQIIRWE